MQTQSKGAASLRAPVFSDLSASLRQGLRDFAAAPLMGLFFASVFVACGLIMAWITARTGQTFWLVLATLGFPLIGAFSALGLYETSRRLETGEGLKFSEIIALLWSHRNGQIAWLAVMVIIIFLFWFFLGHMIFALFLGLSPMTNVSTSLDVFFTTNGLMMLGFGTFVGAIFSTLVFGLSVHGMPMLLDRDVDFVTATMTSFSAMLKTPLLYLAWGAFIGLATLAAMLPLFLGLFVVLPVFGHATWHFYKRIST